MPSEGIKSLEVLEVDVPSVYCFKDEDVCLCEKCKRFRIENKRCLMTQSSGSFMGTWVKEVCINWMDHCFKI